MKPLVGPMLHHVLHSLRLGMVFCLLVSQVSTGPVSPQRLTLLPRTFKAVPQGGIRAQGHIVLLLVPTEPAFVGAYAIPDTYNPHDDKVYIFFRETAMEAGQWERRHIHARVARVCKVSSQGQQPVVSCPTRWAFTCSGPRSIPNRGM